MIKPNEIRLGNMFHPIIKKDWGIEKTYIDHGSIITVGKDRNGVLRIDIDVNNISGIPITEEWLLKAGFKKATNETYYFKSDDNYGFKDSAFFIDYGNECCVYIENIKYVHKLQNLWYSLTGQELTFNL